MKLENILSGSFKYPFKDLKHLCIIFLMFALTLIAPIGIYYGNEYITITGIVTLIIFLLIFPGYLLSVVNAGINGSVEIPSIRIVKNILNSLKLLVLNICYITIPTTVVFLILSFSTGSSISPNQISADFAVPFVFFSNFLQIVIVTALAAAIFSVISFVAKARLADTNSLVEALKINRVLKDIRKIGIMKLIGWYLVMAVLIGIIRTVAADLIFIPYAGFVIYICIVLPILILIFYYSLGMLYSDMNNVKKAKEIDLNKFEKEIEYLKYKRRF